MSRRVHPRSSLAQVMLVAAGALLPELAFAQTLALPDLSTVTTPTGEERSLAQPDVATETLVPAPPLPGGTLVLRPSLDTARADAPMARERRDPEPLDLFAGPDAAQMPAAGPVNSRAEPAAPSAEAAAAPVTGAVQPPPGRPAQPLARAINPPLSAGVSGEIRSIFDSGRATRSSTALEQVVRRPEGDPFAPVGITAGRFILYPELIQALGVSSNLDRRAGGKGGAFSETTVAARLLSDFSENEAEVNASLGYRRNFAGSDRDRPSVALDGRYRLDIDRLTRATLRGALEYRKEDSDDTSAGLPDERGDADRFRGSLSMDLERELGRFALRGTGTVARSTLERTRREAWNEDYTTLTAGLRLGYELSPALRPFVEASLGRRLFDDATLPGSGVDRDALIPAGRVGLALDLSEKLAGEIALGYATSRPDDDRLGSRGAATVDASLAWSPLRGTDITFGARTGFEPDSSGGSASIDYETSLRLRHILTSRLDLLASLIAEFSDSTLPQADETTYTAELGFNYWLNRSLALTGLVSHSRMEADVASRGYDATGIHIGVRLQR